MKKFLSTLKDTLPSIAIIAAIAFVAWLVLHKILDALNVLDSKPQYTPIPTDTSNSTGTNTALPNGWTPEAITNAIHQDVNEWWGVRNMDAWNELAVSSNAQLAMIANEWLDLYYNEDQQTLKQAIQGEMISFFDTSFRDVRDVIVNRLTSIGL